MESSSKARSYRQCFICRVWSWDVLGEAAGCIGVDLCLPCYVDVLEVRQARGVMGAEGTRYTPSARDGHGQTPESDGSPGNSPSSSYELDLFD